MDITRRCDYACRMLRAVCKNGGERISVAEVAEAESIPYSFARSIQHDLVKAGFLRTVRGAHGGITLAREVDDITVLEVLRAVEGSIGISPCSDDPCYCENSASCAYHRVWCGADRLLADYFGGITLADLFPAEAAGASGLRVRPMRVLLAARSAPPMARRSGGDAAADATFEVAWPAGGLSRAAFVEQVRVQGVERYRDLPWRHIDDAYAVLVSEIMLQQTQVARVERFWRRFLAAFPTIDALAAASTSDVLELWQGLGYNRRALALKRAADTCAAAYDGQLPRTYDELIALPGIGPATAAGVMAFAYEQPGVYLETNVRAVFIHDVFPQSESVSDKELIPLVAAVCPPVPASAAGNAVAGGGACGTPGAYEPRPLESPRDWYYALLDYGAHLKATGVNPTRKSAHYTRQSAFEGSRRQKRAWIVRRVLAAPEGVSLDAVRVELDACERAAGREAVPAELVSSIVDDLLSEGFFKRTGGLLLP